MVVGISRLDRMRGALLGLAVGDALGAPLDGMKPGHKGQVYGEITGFVDPEAAWKGRPNHWSLRGLYTGATQQTLAVADILASDGRFDPRSLAEVLIELAEAHIAGRSLGCHRRSGRGFRRAIENLRSREIDPLDCGDGCPDIGAAPRAVPIGLHFAGDAEGRIRASIEASLPTHRDARAVASAIGTAAAVACFMSAEAEAPASPVELAFRIAEEVRRGERLLAGEYGGHLIVREGAESIHGVSECIEIVSRLLYEGDDRLACDSIVRQANRCGAEPAVREPGSEFAPAALMSSLYIALGGRTFLDAVPAALMLGRESSSLGAIAGAVIGARDGDEAIPSRWIEGLRNGDQIRLRADNLARGEIDYSGWRGIVDLEREATGDEERERQRLTSLWEKEGLLPRKAKKRRAKPEPEPPAFAPPPEVWLGTGRREQRRASRERDRRRRERKKAGRGETNGWDR